MRMRKNERVVEWLWTMKWVGFGFVKLWIEKSGIVGWGLLSRIGVSEWGIVMYNTTNKRPSKQCGRQK